VTIRRALAEAEPAAYLPALAMALWGFAWVRTGDAAELSEALAAAREAIRIYEALVEELPDAFSSRLRSVRHTLADVLDGLGRTDEAAELRRQLDGDTDPERSATS
jgi:hypothetical protein